MMDERFDVTVLGEVIGTASGWDGMDYLEVLFYNFEPSNKISGLDGGDVCVNYNNGKFEYYNDEGLVEYSVSIVSVIMSKIP